MQGAGFQTTSSAWARPLSCSHSNVRGLPHDPSLLHRPAQACSQHYALEGDARRAGLRICSGNSLAASSFETRGDPNGCMGQHPRLGMEHGRHANGRATSTRLRPCQAVSEAAVVRSRTAGGLYGLPKLSTAACFAEFMGQAEQLGLSLLTEANSKSGTELSLCVQDFEQRIGELLAPTAHCKDHHSEPSWRAAAATTQESLLRLRHFVYIQLTSLPAWQAVQRGELETPLTEDAEAKQGEKHLTGELQQPEETEVLSALSQLLQRTVNFEGGSSVQEFQEARELSSLQDICNSALSSIFGGDADLLPTLILCVSEVEGDVGLLRLVKPFDAQAKHPSTHGSLSLESLRSELNASAVSAAAGPMDEARGWEEVECSDHPVLGIGPDEHVPLFGTHSVCLGPAVYVTQAAAEALRKEDPSEADLCCLLLDRSVAVKLIKGHPSGRIRRIVYEGFFRPRADAAIQLMEVVRLLRDDMADISGHLSFAHMQMAGAYTAEPKAALKFLLDVAQAVQPVADSVAADSVAMLGELSSYPTSGSSDPESMGDSRLRPWDVDFIKSELLAHHGYELPWEDVAAYFSLGACVQGLSTLLERSMGLSLQINRLAVGEAWAPGLLRVDVSGNVSSTDHRQEPVGVLYIFSDPECNTPFTTLISPGSQRTESYAGDLPRVAVHLAAHQLMDGGGGSQECLPKDPSLVKNIFHELGHAMHYLLSARAAGSCSWLGCATSCSTDMREVPSHLFEHLLKDPSCVQLISQHYSTGRPLPQSTCKTVAGFYARQRSPLDLQQQVLMALLDLKMHGPLHPSSVNSNNPTGAEEAEVTGDQGDVDRTGVQSTFEYDPPESLISVSQRLWGRLSSLSSTLVTDTSGGLTEGKYLTAQQPVFPAATLHTMTLIPGIIDAGADMHAYLLAQILAAAIWRLHLQPAVQVNPDAGPVGFSFGEQERNFQEDASGGWRVRKTLLGAGASTSLEEVVVQLLGNDSIEHSDSWDGWIPNLSHPVYDEIEL